jgi:hypothetical protein
MASLPFCTLYISQSTNNGTKPRLNTLTVDYFSCGLQLQVDAQIGTGPTLLACISTGTFCVESGIHSSQITSCEDSSLC